MSNDLVVHQNKNLIPTESEFKIIETVARAAAGSKYFDKLGGEQGILCIALYAWEIGISPMTAVFGGFSNVQGKPTMSAEMMNSLIRQRGHKIEIVECNRNICRIKGTRKDTGESYIATFSIDDAKAAGLVKGGGAYEKHLEDMLFARAIGRLKRRLFPDVASKAYVEGELDDPIDVTQDVSVQDVPCKVVEVEKPYVETLSAEEANKLLDMIGDDTEYAKRILSGYKVHTFNAIPKYSAKGNENFIILKDTINAYNLNKELSNKGTANV